MSFTVGRSVTPSDKRIQALASWSIKQKSKERNNWRMRRVINYKPTVKGCPYRSVHTGQEEPALHTGLSPYRNKGTAGIIN
jgi:hypothetical protein